MPNWAQVLQEINDGLQAGDMSAFDTVRRKYLRALHEYTGRPTIAYYSGWLTKRVVGTEINDEDKNGFMLCVHGLPKDRGLDLVLHTPGGGIAPTASIIHYLHSIFGSDIRAIIPQISMSAGTIIACSCKSIVMGRQSNIGPTDPQMNGIPAFATKAEFEKAYKEILENPRAAPAWAPILQQLHPTFLQQCDYAIAWTENFVRECLAKNMFSGAPDAEAKANAITARLLDFHENKAHDKHFHVEECLEMGLNVEIMEKDQKFQDLVLTLHHCFMHTLTNSAAFKIIENYFGNAFVKQVPPPAPTFVLQGAAMPSA
ncbi:SDH family Clp fold serine proteinase [Pleomorphomonas oryzae]|uniref:SDH family Clp fold serine proteinase n=1 Tax=Pleomorphomonas oryzae TaxID=261934 RepID=UPI000A05E8D7|nr:hypothetical protein [Pleomorphomonas oryzae]